MTKARDEQIAEIMRIMSAGRMTCEEAQAIIDSHATNERSGAQGPALAGRPVSLASWEKRITGFGDRVQGFLHPFLYWEPKLRLPNQERIERALRQRYDDFCRPVLIPQSNIRELWSRWKEAITPEDGRAHLYDLKNMSAEAHVRRQLESAMPEMFGSSHLDRLPARIRALLSAQLVNASVKLICFDGDADFYRPFFELWLFGNYPLGQDEEHNALILVAG